MTDSCRTYNLSDAVSLYCAMQFNDHRRGYKNFLVIAEQVWEDIFTNTLWAGTSEWLAVQRGNPYPVIELPDNMGRFLGLYQKVHYCNSYRLIPVKQATTFDTKPLAEKVCSCAQNCGCGSACSEANSLSYTESTMQVEGVNYIHRQWFETCANGDVIEWREMPTKIYRSLDTSGQLSSDFDEEFDVRTERFDAGIVKLRRRVGALELKPCGCVAETASNRSLLVTRCGCAWDTASSCSREAATTFRASHDRKSLQIINSSQDSYYLRYQQNGASENSEVPQYAIKTLWDGMTYYSKMYVEPNPKVVGEWERKYNRSKFGIVQHLNPIDWDRLHESGRRISRYENIQTELPRTKPTKQLPEIPASTTENLTPITSTGQAQATNTLPYLLPYQL